MNKVEILKQFIQAGEESISSLKEELNKIEKQQQKKSEEEKDTSMLFCDALKKFMEDPDVEEIYREDWQDEDETRVLVSTISDEGMPVLVWKIDDQITWLMYKPDPEDIFATDWCVA